MEWPVNMAGIFDFLQARILLKHFINVFFVELIKVQVKTEDVASMSRVPNIPCCLAMFAQHVKIAIAIFHRFCYFSSFFKPLLQLLWAREVFTFDIDSFAFACLAGENPVSRYVGLAP